MSNEHTEALVTPEVKPPKAWYARLSLTGALTIIIGVAVIIVAVAYALYWNDSDRKYDIARGGNTSENQALDVDDSEVDRISPVSASDTQQKLEYLQKEIDALKGIGDFDPEDVSDQNLQLISPSEPSL